MQNMKIISYLRAFLEKLNCKTGFIIVCGLLIFNIVIQSYRDEKQWTIGFPIRQSLPRISLNYQETTSSDSRSVTTQETTSSDTWSATTQETTTTEATMMSTNTSIYTNTFLDIMNMPQINFNKSYKNPCWIGTKDNGPLDDGKFHCLPYFHIMGVKKSGTSDLYSRISSHPDILQNHRFKESQWIPRCRFNDTFRVKPCNSITYVELAKKVDIRSLGYYTSLYAPSASAIRKAAHVGPGGNPNFGKIFGDATPANFHMHSNWPELPGNEGLTEPKYTNFNYISHLTPDVKLIVIFREPVSRLLSDFKYGRVATIEANPEKYIRKFHNQCVEMIKMYKECFSLYSHRQCIYMSNPNNTNSQMRLKFTAGFYSFFMKEMYALFNKKNILPILMTDYTNDMKNTIAKVFDFLELGQPNEEQWENILKQTIQNKSRAKSVRMWNETELLLKEFYKPLNEDLAELLNDSRFLFKN